MKYQKQLRNRLLRNYGKLSPQHLQSKLPNIEGIENELGGER
ncbi:hypothetical protein [Methylobacter psychrophilus]|nr:hypothetical protein [Methylobacter psychrophilus]